MCLKDIKSGFASCHRREWSKSFCQNPPFKKEEPVQQRHEIQATTPNHAAPLSSDDEEDTVVVVPAPADHDDHLAGAALADDPTPVPSPVELLQLQLAVEAERLAAMERLAALQTEMLAELARLAALETEVERSRRELGRALETSTIQYPSTKG